MPRKRKIASNANSWSSVTPSIRIKIKFTRVAQNGDEHQLGKFQEMESLLQKHNSFMPCISGSDRFTNWESSSECNGYDYYDKVRILVLSNISVVQLKKLIAGLTSWHFTISSTVAYSRKKL